MVNEYLPLNHADFHIMLALGDDERHGYAIMLHVEELTQGEMKMGPGTLYTSIKRLLASGMIDAVGVGASAAAVGGWIMASLAGTVFLPHAVLYLMLLSFLLSDGRRHPSATASQHSND